MGVRVDRPATPPPGRLQASATSGIGPTWAELGAEDAREAPSIKGGHCARLLHDTGYSGYRLPSRCCRKHFYLLTLGGCRTRRPRPY